MLKAKYYPQETLLPLEEYKRIILECYDFAQANYKRVGITSRSLFRRSLNFSFRDDRDYNNLLIGTFGHYGFQLYRYDYNDDSDFKLQLTNCLDFVVKMATE